MIDERNLIERDLRHIWHPCAQMKDYQQFKPMQVVAANHCYIELEGGKKIIDAISSWWCKSLGHNHPRLQAAIKKQIAQFEHVMFAHTTHESIVRLSEQLAQLTKHLRKVFYAGDGSCAIEIAMKMSIHARQIQGEQKRHLFVALENGYHGETIGALSVSDLKIYKNPYQSMLMPVQFISSLPYVHGRDDSLWLDCEEQWHKIEKQLAVYADQITAIIVEPILQAAGGMKIYSQDFLRRLRAWTKQHDIHLIADEIMTGIGRTGTMLACEHAEIEPDLLCLSKGLTSGWLPLSAVLVSDKLYDVFYDDYEQGKSFLHSHTFTGNPLAASVATEVLTIMKEENLCHRAGELGNYMRLAMQEIAASTKKLTNVRGIGAMVAADIVLSHPSRRVSFDIYRQAAELGAILRPLGNTIYWVPPLTMERSTLSALQEITEKAIILANL